MSRLYLLRDSRRKIERAKQKVGELNTILAGFRKANLYGVVREVNNETGHQIWRASNVKPLPDEIYDLTSETLHPLRSSLDYLAHSLVKTSGNIPEKRCGFPIFLDSKMYEAMSPRMIKGASARAIAQIHRLQPFNSPYGPDDPLWLLHELNNTDKHRLPIALASGVDINTVTMTHTEGSGGHSGTLSFCSTINYGWRRVENGAELLAVYEMVPPMDVNPEFTQEVVLPKTGGAPDEPLGPFLHQLTDYVGRIVDAFTSEFV